MAVKTYDPKKVVVSFGGAPLTGFAPGTFVEITYDEDAWTKMVGADGEGARARNANRGGKVKVTLMQTSVSNDVLSGYFVADRDLGTGALPLFVKDLLGRSLAVAVTAWIMKAADVKFGKELDTREWTFDTDNLEVFVGGNL